MTQTNFCQVLKKIETSLARMQEQAKAVRWYCEASDMEQAYEKALRLEECSEKLTLLTRVLPAYTGRPGADLQVQHLLALSIPVEIGFTAEGWFSVRIPALLPKKAAGSADYIRSFLYPAMRDFFGGKPPVRYRDCVLIFRHVYDWNRPERQMRDHDNIEVNMVADIVAMYVMPDDGPSVCSHFYCSSSASEDRTEVYVVPRADFPMWIVTERAMPDKGVMLYEELPIQPEKPV